VFGRKMANLQVLVALVSLLCAWEIHSQTSASKRAMDVPEQMTVEDRYWKSEWDVETNVLNYAEPCINDGGYRCKHEFEYTQSGFNWKTTKTYYQCTTDASPNGNAWCYDESGSWDYCTKCKHHRLCPWRCDVCPNRWDGPCTDWCTHDEVWKWARCEGKSNKATDCSNCEASIGVLNEGKDCWGGCRGRQGRCQQYCGDGYCCRYGWAGQGCNGLLGIQGKGHVCVAADFKEQAKARQDAIHKKWCCKQLRLNPSFTPAAGDKKAGNGPTGHPIGNRVWHERNCPYHVGGTSKSNCNKDSTETSWVKIGIMQCRQNNWKGYRSSLAECKKTCEENEKNSFMTYVERGDRNCACEEKPCSQKDWTNCSTCDHYELA